MFEDTTSITNEELCCQCEPGNIENPHAVALLKNSWTCPEKISINVLDVFKEGRQTITGHSDILI